jgi:hypothetical protein
LFFFLKTKNRVYVKRSLLVEPIGDQAAVVGVDGLDPASVLPDRLFHFHSAAGARQFGQLEFIVKNQ